MERGRVLKRHGLFFYSPSQTGKASGLKYLCRTDRVDYSLGFINGSASEARLCGFELDLALAEKVRDLKFWCRADELYFCERSEVVWYILAFPDGEGGRPRCWCRSDRVDYSLGFIYGSASEARLYGVLIKELIDKKAYLGIFAALRKQQAKTFTTAAMLRELHLIPWLRQDLLLRSKVNTLKPAFGWRKGKPCNLVPPLKKEAFDGSPFWIAFLFFEFLFPISFSIFLFLSLSYICL